MTWGTAGAMTRMMALAAAIVLAGCSGGGEMQLGTGQPSLRTARAAMASGAPSLALTVCNGLVAQDRRNAEALACQGDANTALNQPAAADAAYTAAILADPKSAEGTLGLGRLRLATDPARAEALFLQALASHPRDPVALNDLGIARDLLGRHAEAQEAYGKAIAANPDMRAAQVNLALSMALEGRPGEAARLLAPLAAGPDATARERHDLAAALAMDGRAAEAAQVLGQDLQGADLDAAIAGYRALLVQ